MGVELIALLGGVGLLLLLMVLAAIVQWRRPPGDGTSVFVILVGVVVVFAIIALFNRAGA